MVSRSFISMAVAACCFSLTWAETGSPRSLGDQLGSIDDVAHIVRGELDVAGLLAADRTRDGRAPQRVAQPEALALDVVEAATWEQLAGGERVARLRITSPGATFQSFKFSSFELPEGTELFFVSVFDEYDDGPYGAQHNRPSRRFGSPMVPGESALIELVLREGGTEPTLVLESVSRGYRPVFGMASFARRTKALTAGQVDVRGPVPMSPTTEGLDFSCQRDINCPEGAPYQDVKRAVAEGYDGEFVCSGTMVNNTSEDNRYLYLTADHCEFWLDPPTMVYYWNYENSGCGTNDAPLDFSTGSTNLFHSPVADIHLLELDGVDIETTYNIYYAGWNRNASPASSGATISFPADKPKQIAIDNDPITDCSPAGCLGGFGPNYWRVAYDISVTEVGSSGAGLLNQDQHVVGVLTGGVGTDCTDFEWDEYGRLDVEWTSLAPHLDPDSTGVQFLAGRDHAASAAPPPVSDGSTGTPMLMTKGSLPDRIDVSFDAATCSSTRAAVLWGNLGNWTAYQGDVGVDCSLGNSGTGAFDFAGTNVWFNLVWIDADNVAGNPGSSSSGVRSWQATGLCAATQDDPTGTSCF